jgi:hypothetical protein
MSRVRHTLLSLHRPAALLASAALLLSAVPAAAQQAPKSDLEIRLDKSIERAAEFLWTKQKTNTVRMFRKIYTAAPEVIDVPGVKWGDVTIVPNTKLVKIKGKTYDEVDCVIPPGWFEPEPFGSDVPRGGPKRPGYDGDITPWFGVTTCLITQALLTTRLYDPNKHAGMKLAVECVAYMHMWDPGDSGRPGEALQPGAPMGGNVSPLSKLAGKRLIPGIHTTYGLGVHAPALEMAIRRGVKGELLDQCRRALAEDMRRLVRGIGDDPDSGYTYFPKLAGSPAVRGPSKWDLSNSQYGILGLWAGVRGGVELDPAKAWEHFNKLIVREQQKDGGWGYAPDFEPEPSPTMTTAGIASLFVVLDNYWTKTRGYNGPDISPFSNTPLLMKTLMGIDKGLDYFGRIYKPYPDAYFLYGVERIGEASGYKYFGEHDWFLEGVQMLLQSQDGDGSYGLPGLNGRYYGKAVTTALALLFACHGRGPILLNKLSYGPKNEWQWHNYPRDAANVARWFDRKYETEVNWQVVTLQKDKEADLHDAQVLYISGYKELKFENDEVEMLRRYVEGGGTILIVACGGKIAARKFLESAEELGRRMYPPADYPEYRMTALPPMHPVALGLGSWSGKGPKPKEALRTEVWHVHNGHRSFLFVVPEDVGHIWQAGKWAQREEAFHVFGHVRNYATDKGLLPSRFRVPNTAGYPQSPARGSVRVGTVKYTSLGKLTVDADPGRKGKSEEVEAKADWAAAGAAWSVFRPWMQHATGYDITETRGVDLAGVRPGEFDVLHMSGHYAFKLSDAEISGLKRFVEGGGTLLVEAVGGHDVNGDREFYKTARTVFGGMFPKAPLNPLEGGHPVITGAIPGTTGFNCSEVGYSRHVLLAQNLKSPALQAIKLDGRAAVIISPFGLSCGLTNQQFWERDGYAPRSARELTANILQYAKSGGR